LDTRDTRSLRLRLRLILGPGRAFWRANGSPCLGRSHWNAGGIPKRMAIRLFHECLALESAARVGGHLDSCPCESLLGGPAVTAAAAVRAPGAARSPGLDPHRATRNDHPPTHSSAPQRLPVNSRRDDHRRDDVEAPVSNSG
jgi:hypothetical protein